MSAYPSIPQRWDTVKTPDYGTVVDRAESGKPRLRTFHSQDWPTFVVKHDCTKAQAAAILAHFDANANSEFNFTWFGDSNVYVVRYAEKPKADVMSEGDWDWQVESTLIVLSYTDAYAAHGAAALSVVSSLSSAGHNSNHISGSASVSCASSVTVVGSSGNFLEFEGSSDHLLLETGDSLLLEV